MKSVSMAWTSIQKEVFSCWSMTVAGTLWLCQNSYWSHDPVEIVDFPIKHGGSFHSYVSLPEGRRQDDPWHPPYPWSGHDGPPLSPEAAEAAREVVLKFDSSPYYAQNLDHMYIYIYIHIYIIYIYNPLSNCWGEAGGEDFLYKMDLALFDHL